MGAPARPSGWTGLLPRNPKGVRKPVSEGRHTHGGLECDKRPPGPTPGPEKRESGSQKLAESLETPGAH